MKTSAAARMRSRKDRVFMVAVVVVALAALVLLAWDHLGLGALIFPPPASATQQTAQAGPYQVTFQSESKRLTVGGANTILFMLHDQAQRTVADASLRITPTMTTMPMTAPAFTVSAGGYGRYTAHPRFSMAGAWRLNLTITVPNAPPASASFPVSVYWN